MTVELCDGLPPEWWYSTDDAARLGLAICHRCPAKDGCLAGDPKPRGVVRAGVAYTDDGYPFAACATCGYPRRANVTCQPDECLRCVTPAATQWRGFMKTYSKPLYGKAA